MKERIAALAREIKTGYDGIRGKARAARAADASLAVPVSRSPVTGSVCAVDGGLLAQRMHGADIVVVRAVGVNFIYQNSKLKTFSHHPSRSPQFEVELKNSLDEHGANAFRSLVRLRHELACAVSMIEKFSPDALFIDGSLLPVPSDRPADGSGLSTQYAEVLALYGKLVDSAKAKNCLLCGVIKDSRSRKLSERLGFSCSDSLLCNFLLDEGERTQAMPYFEANPPSKDLAALGKNISAFYLKPSKSDLPLRIELLGKEVDKAASLVCSLSSISENFAYPAVLVEADMCAALDPREMEPIEGALLSLSGLRPLRRNSRPFR